MLVVRPLSWVANRARAVVTVDASQSTFAKRQIATVFDARRRFRHRLTVKEMTYIRSLALTALVLASAMTVRALDVSPGAPSLIDIPRRDETAADATAQASSRDVPDAALPARPSDALPIPFPNDDDVEAEDVPYVADNFDWDAFADGIVVGGRGIDWEPFIFDVPMPRAPRRAGPMFYANDDVASMPSTWYSAYASESVHRSMPRTFEASWRWTTTRSVDWVSFCDDLCSLMCLGFMISIFVLIGLVYLISDDDDDGCERCKRCKRCGVSREVVFVARPRDGGEDLLPLLKGDDDQGKKTCSRDICGAC